VPPLARNDELPGIGARRSASTPPFGTAGGAAPRGPQPGAPAQSVTDILRAVHAPAESSPAAPAPAADGQPGRSAASRGGAQGPSDFTRVLRGVAPTAGGVKRPSPAPALAAAPANAEPSSTRAGLLVLLAVLALIGAIILTAYFVWGR
jgi:hypothetical protein